ncbi:MAG TPA: metal ABC transporter permease [Vicinamibacteria bacterium]|nr:metal ABC transporter permease [Vicinamibacteria bacterium]
MDFLLEPLRQGFMQRALVAGTLVGVVGALLGVFVVQRGLSFLSDGLAHAAFGGIALGLLLGASSDSALWVALPFTVAVALGISAVHRRSGLTGDAATGVFFALAFALGVFFLGLRSPSATAVNVESLLFGSILAVSPDVLRAMWVMAGLTAVLVALFWSRLAYATFDPELAAIGGVKVASLDRMLLALVALAVVLGVKTVGVVLVSAFIVIPAATARLMGGSFAGIAARAVLIGVVGSGVGLVASYHLNVASGATIILVLGLAFFLALVAAGRAPH